MMPLELINPSEYRSDRRKKKKNTKPKQNKTHQLSITVHGAQSLLNSPSVSLSTLITSDNYPIMYLLIETSA